MTAEEVKRLQVGEAVYLCGDGGESVSCIVAGHGGKKFLTYRDKGQIKRFAIRDYSTANERAAAPLQRDDGKDDEEIAPIV